MSLSSPTRLGSIATRRTSCLHVIVTLTIPAPDWPSTSVRPAHPACASCSLHLLRCCISPAICPSSWCLFRIAVVTRTNRVGSTDAPKFSINSRTKGSAYIDSSAVAALCARLICDFRGGGPTVLPTSAPRRIGRPSASLTAVCNFCNAPASSSVSAEPAASNDRLPKKRARFAARAQRTRPDTLSRATKPIQSPLTMAGRWA